MADSNDGTTQKEDKSNSWSLIAASTFPATVLEWYHGPKRWARTFRSSTAIDPAISDEREEGTTGMLPHVLAPFQTHSFTSAPLFFFSFFSLSLCLFFLFQYQCDFYFVLISSIIDQYNELIYIYELGLIERKREREREMLTKKSDIHRTQLADRIEIMKLSAWSNYTPQNRWVEPFKSILNPNTILNSWTIPSKCTSLQKLN